MSSPLRLANLRPVSPRGRFAALVALGLASLGAGCLDYDDPVAPHGTRPAPDADANGPQTTWHGHVRPLVEAHCASCHAAGGIGSMPLDSYAATEGVRQLMVARVNHVNGVGAGLAMPPWPPAADCRQLRDARTLTAADKATFSAWEASGFPEGDPASYVAPAPREAVELGAPALTLSRPDPYSPNRVSPDDYRCFLFDKKVTSDTWVTAVDILPDKPEVVHHVLLFVVPADDVSKIEALDDASPSVPGYPCVGGSGSSNDALLAGWVPGMRPLVFPGGAAFPVRKGSRFVAQMHYNTTNLAYGAAAPADATGAQLWALTPGQQPLREVRIRPVADVNLDIAKGSPEEVEGLTLRTPYSETAVGVIPHMHLLGKSLRLEIERPGNPTRQCLVDIPQWDFHWQQTYMFADGAELDLHLGDKVHLSCVYDNSAANQAIVDGVRREPEDVRWGEGTFDEMCLSYVVTTTPIYDDGGATLCDGFEACHAAECEGSPADAMCPIDCLSWAGLACVECALGPIYATCALAEGCGLQLASLNQCRQRCAAETPLIECVLESCQDEFAALHICVAPAIAEGSCNDEAAACGIGYLAE